jgi:hypothetical protein
VSMASLLLPCCKVIALLLAARSASRFGRALTHLATWIEHPGITYLRVQGRVAWAVTLVVRGAW